MRNRKLIPNFIILITVLALSSCATIPEGTTAVKPFAKEKYLGKWYEIARLDFMFEKNLNNTTAEYLLNDDTTIKVINRGYNVKKEKWKSATGKAKFVNDDQTGMLRVSFCGPFYAGYNVIAIDKDYKYALVAGKSLKYLWILSRETTIPNNIKDQYIKKAQEIGYNTSELIWVEHNKN